MKELFSRLSLPAAALDAAHIILALMVLILAIALVVYMHRNARLEEVNEWLQKDYAPRRKRVYQAYVQLLSEVYGNGVMDLTEARQEALRRFQFEVMMWGNEPVIRTFVELHALLNAGKDTPPERFEKLLFRGLLAMRDDLGFSNKGLSWQRLRDSVIVPKG